MVDILHRVVIHAAPDAVYNAITTQDGLQHWWTADAECKSQVGAVAQFGFGGRRVLFRMRIDELTAPKTVCWHCLGDVDAWKDTDFTFELEPQGKETVLNFAQRGWRNGDEVYAQCNTDWAYFLFSLKRYLETGTGTPDSGK